MDHTISLPPVSCGAKFKLIGENPLDKNIYAFIAWERNAPSEKKRHHLRIWKGSPYITQSWSQFRKIDLGRNFAERHFVCAAFNETFDQICFLSLPYDLNVEPQGIFILVDLKSSKIKRLETEVIDGTIENPIFTLGHTVKGWMVSSSARAYLLSARMPDYYSHRFWKVSFEKNRLEPFAFFSLNLNDDFRLRNAILTAISGRWLAWLPLFNVTFTPVLYLCDLSGSNLVYSKYNPIEQWESKKCLLNRLFISKDRLFLGHLNQFVLPNPKIYLQEHKETVSEIVLIDDHVFHWNTVSTFPLLTPVSRRRQCVYSAMLIREISDRRFLECVRALDSNGQQNWILHSNFFGCNPPSLKMLATVAVHRSYSKTEEMQVVWRSFVNTEFKPSFRKVTVFTGGMTIKDLKKIGCFLPNVMAFQSADEVGSKKKKSEFIRKISRKVSNVFK